MRLFLTFSIGIAIGCAPYAFSVVLLRGTSEVLGPATSAQFQALVVRSMNQYLPRPLAREDIVENLSSVEEEDDCPATDPDGAIAPLGLPCNYMPSSGLPWLPRRSAATSPSWQPSFQLLC